MSKHNKKLALYDGLEDYLAKVSLNKWKDSHNNRTLPEAYDQIKINLKETQESIVSGAMASEIRGCISTFGAEIEEIENRGESAEEKVKNFLSSDHIIFLNDHGPNHVRKVIERAFSILSRMSQELSDFEVFILLCAIQIHDIGNVLGRIEHEKNLHQIFDDKSKDIIIDTAEKRIIKNIATAHGGKNSNGSKDTISALSAIEPILGVTVKTRFLAAVLRFADELADDSTRANRAALDLGIIGIDSTLYHDYSKVLHTVTIENDTVNHDNNIQLVYELDTSMLSKKYRIRGNDRYLIDEIYDRTLKMEQERRYCMKFMQPYVFINRINVRINIYSSNSQFFHKISYQLEDTSYPEHPIIGKIKDIDEKIPSGEEVISIIRSKGEML